MVASIGFSDKAGWRLVSTIARSRDYATPVFATAKPAVIEEPPVIRYERNDLLWQPVDSQLAKALAYARKRMKVLPGELARKPAVRAKSELMPQWITCGAFLICGTRCGNFP